MTTTNPQVALFIDADNAPASQINQVIKHLSTYGSITVGKAFGNWEKPCLKAWAKQLTKHAIQPVQQFDVTKQKNATDIALTIDVIDTLHTGDVDVFAIMSSDADFTPVVVRLLFAGKIVVGFGDRHANQGFRNACSEFVVIGRKAQPKQVRYANKQPDFLFNTVKLAVSTCATTHGQINFTDVEALLMKMPNFIATSCDSMQLVAMIKRAQDTNLVN